MAALCAACDAPANTLVSSTRAVASGSSTDDTVYISIEGQIQSQTRQRDSLAARMRAILNRAAFGGGEFEVSEDAINNLVRQGQDLLDQSAKLAAAT